MKIVGFLQVRPKIKVKNQYNKKNFSISVKLRKELIHKLPLLVLFSNNNLNNNNKKKNKTILFLLEIYSILAV